MTPERHAEGRGIPGKLGRDVLEHGEAPRKDETKGQRFGSDGNPLMVLGYSVVKGVLWHVEGS